jgi:hypothetical protein
MSFLDRLRRLNSLFSRPVFKFVAFLFVFIALSIFIFHPITDPWSALLISTFRR